MKKISQQMEETLLNYLDRKLSVVERQALEDQLKRDEELKQHFEEIQAAHVLLKQMKVEQPSRNFTSLVMDKLDQAPATKGLSLKGSLLLLTGILMAIAIASLLVSSGVFDGATAVVDFNNLDLSQKYIKFSMPTFIIQGKLIVTTIIFLNIALALIVLDRVVLKPFFRRRMETR